MITRLLFQPFDCVQEFDPRLVFVIGALITVILISKLTKRSWR